MLGSEVENPTPGTVRAADLRRIYLARLDLLDSGTTASPPAAAVTTRRLADVLSSLDDDELVVVDVNADRVVFRLQVDGRILHSMGLELRADA